MSNRQAKLILLSSQGIYVLFLFVWFFFATVSIMMFDAPGSENNDRLVALFTLIWLYPIGLIVGVFGSWINYRKNRFTKALLFNSIPLIWLVPIVVVVIYANTR